MGWPRVILCCLAAAAAALTVRAVFSPMDLPDFIDLKVFDWVGAAAYSFGFGVLFAAIYEVLRARGAVRPGVPGGLAYGLGLLLVAILPSVSMKDPIRDPMELLPLAGQYLIAGAAVGAIAVPSRRPVAENDEPFPDSSGAVAPFDIAVRLRNSAARGNENVALPGAPARWNVVSLGAPFVGFVCGVLAGMSAPHFQWFFWGFSVWLGFVAFGLLSAAIALGRAERPWAVTAAGLALNGVLLFLLVPAVVGS